MDHKFDSEEKVATRVVQNGSRRAKIEAMSQFPSDCESPRTELVAKEPNPELTRRKITKVYTRRNKGKALSEVTRPKITKVYTRRNKGKALSKVKETLRLFNGHCKKIIQEAEASREKRLKGTKLRVDFKAASILKEEDKYLNSGKKIIGSVPGVYVGDEFQYRVELNILGIHSQIQAGIDTMIDENKKRIATCIVSSGCYGDSVKDTDVLIYTGHGGNVEKGQKQGQRYRPPKDQELKRGNKALFNSIEKKNPVRVIRGHKKTTPKFLDGTNYVYDGLYMVEKCWQKTGSHSKLVYRFKLRRLPGQPPLSWRAVKKAKTSTGRKGLCSADISGGKERLPICAVNEVDDEKPPEFEYMVKMTYPDSCKLLPKGSYCNGKKRCSGCAWIGKNEGDYLPYNRDGAIVYTTPFVYECGPRCKCPLSCYLRVTQRGIKFKLEIFKTKTRGWGVRSLNSIPSGSFVCEYVGELLEEKEAEKLVGRDEYLFDMDKQEDETSGFTINGAEKGNVGRFINHSCSPNLYAQNVLYDHEDERMPHVTFFAMDNIPPLQELTYHYHYKVDEVCDSDGNIKMKDCFCGSIGCTGRLY